VVTGTHQTWPPGVTMWIFQTLMMASTFSIRKGLYFGKRHVLEMGEQHGDYKEAGPSVCVPRVLSPRRDVVGGAGRLF
jgi:hypothetical protein